MASSGNKIEKKEFKVDVILDIDVMTGDAMKVKLSIIKTEDQKKYLDIRYYYMDEIGAWHPTKKGIWLKLNGGDFTAEDILNTGLELIQTFRGNN